MKRLLIILTILISGVVSGQCDPEIQDCSEAFSFLCDINPLTITDDEIQAFADRDALLQALVGLTTSKGQIVTAVEYPISTTVFKVTVRTAWGSFTQHTGGDALILDEIHPETFREFYRNVLNYIINDF